MTDAIKEQRYNQRYLATIKYNKHPSDKMYQLNTRHSTLQ